MRLTDGRTERKSTAIARSNRVRFILKTIYPAPEMEGKLGA